MPSSLKDELLRLLREDEEFRLAVMGLLGYTDLKSSVDRLAGTVDELVRVVKELVGAVKSHDERLAKHDERIARLEGAVEELTKAIKSHDERITRLEDAVKELVSAVRSHEERLAKVEERLARLEQAVEELTKAVKSHDERIARLEDAVRELIKAIRVHDERLNAFDRRLMALGARWGVESEEAFRNAMRGVVEEILGVARVSKWVYFDRDGIVYGHPSQVDVDVAIRDGTHILIEVKASASSGDVLEFSRVGKLYEVVTGIKPRLVLVTPFIDEKGLEIARKLGVEVYTNV
ncbi:MAG: DUF3782 domain-containing protein [Vulcanisaeta sp.]|nr:DUF3782 domain-containing protein [Vulcanisaeta sp.]MCG2891932.1 DUF3782 domain-containing protein [Vulcanisaeta sp.]MCG2894600.1 DUF3782 domain-containing protein [Vulcanisaeta sp.]